MALATDAADTLPIDIATAATPPLPSVMLSPDHCPHAKRESYQLRADKERNQEKEVTNESGSAEPPSSSGSSQKKETPETKKHGKENKQEDFTSSDDKEATMDILILIGLN